MWAEMRTSTTHYCIADDYYWRTLSNKRKMPAFSQALQVTSDLSGDYLSQKDICNCHCFHCHHQIITWQKQIKVGMVSFCSPSAGVTSQRINHCVYNRDTYALLRKQCFTFLLPIYPCSLSASCLLISLETLKKPRLEKKNHLAGHGGTHP